MRAMSDGGRVLTGLSERRELRAAFGALAETSNIDQLVEKAQAIAEHGSAVVPILVSLLDTTDPQTRGGLGQVAAHLKPEEIVPALRGVARSRERSDTARLTAMMILDRYLHETVDESLLVGLQDPDVVAVQSLRELSHEMAQNPFVVIEYLAQLAEQPAEVAGVVLDAIPRLGPDPQLIALLRMFAQGADETLAQQALDQLSRSRTPDAMRALATLALTLPPTRAALAERGLRKLQMMGLSSPEAAPAAGWRSLLSAIDGTGAQVVWFLRQPEGAAQGQLLSLLCKDPDGIVASFGSSEVPADHLPPALPLGAEYVIRQDDGSEPVRLVEAPVDAGRQAVRAALELNWAGGRLPPPEYSLLNPEIWDLGPLPPADDPEPGSYAPALTAALLDHPAFASWYFQTEQVYEAAAQLGRRPLLAERAAVIATLVEAQCSPELVASYRRRLMAMGRWLALAGQTTVAGLAVAAAAHLADLPPAQAPFFCRLTGIGLDVAVANLRSGFHRDRR
jgi:hypothetical protein